MYAEATGRLRRIGPPVAAPLELFLQPCFYVSLFNKSDNTDAPTTLTSNTVVRRDDKNATFNAFFLLCLAGVMRPARSHAVRPHGGIRHNVSLFLAGLLALFILAGTVYLALLATDSRPVALRRPLLRSNAFHRQERVLREGTKNNTPAGDVPQRLLKFESEELHKAMRLSEITVEALSWKPRVFRLHRLLTSDECDELVDLGRPGMEASTVVDMATGGGLLSSVRTSTGTFLTNPTPLTTLIRSRIAHITMLPEENQEAISILRCARACSCVHT